MHGKGGGGPKVAGNLTELQGSAFKPSELPDFLLVRRNRLRISDVLAVLIRKELESSHVEPRVRQPFNDV